MTTEFHRTWDVFGLKKKVSDKGVSKAVAGKAALLTVIELCYGRRLATRPCYSVVEGHVVQHVLGPN